MRVVNKRIFFVVPLPFLDKGKSVHLAAEKKIFFLLDIITSLGHEVIVINSGPKMGENKPCQLVNVKLKNGSNVACFVPETYSSKNFGRLKNLVNIESYFERVTKAFGLPDIIWAYNGYAFEMRVSRYAFSAYGIRTIIEFEDWHYARGGYFRIKNSIDWVFWRLAFNCFQSAFVVNKFLHDKMSPANIPLYYLPGIVDDDIFSIAKNKKPFSDQKTGIFCGYFGGLDADKGVDFLIQLIKESLESDPPVYWLITGHGELETELKSISSKFPKRVRFLGRVSEKHLIECFGMVDIILNPHPPNKGVFPFKLAEAVGAGRMVISGPVSHSAENHWITKVVFQTDMSISLWLKAILNSREVYIKNKSLIRAGVEACRQVASRKSVVEMTVASLAQ